MEAINKQLSEQFSTGNFSYCYLHFPDNVEWVIAGGNTISGKKNVIAY